MNLNVAPFSLKRRAGHEDLLADYEAAGKNISAGSWK